MIEKEVPASSRSLEGLQRLRRARLLTRLSTDELLAQTRGDIGSLMTREAVLLAKDSAPSSPAAGQAPAQIH